ncbi:MAG TPA: aminotransferase class V-fold PLP-dependent enzyme [Candidatus Polarisedimenticolaceae bacterium]|nr:aminotransferase class V-fold PLP-dependent enzyme [Candidatus Polarisedimenticolaceae bacterium]
MFYRTFNPGPSQVTEATKEDVREALKHNIIGISHRSTAFKEIAEQAVMGLRHYFKVPDDYHVLFSSSATEAMELVVRNLVASESFHFTNGNFSELFARISESLGKITATDAVPWGRQNNTDLVKIPGSAEIVTLTYNETSTGVTADAAMVDNLHRRVNETLFVVDITSAAGCVPLDIPQADVWLFSVQKGMGLPAGLGVLFISPKAFERSQRQKQTGIFNFSKMVDHITNYQTIQTPNVLGIYLLARQLERWNRLPRAFNFTETRAKAGLLDKFVNRHDRLAYFVKDPKFRSKTVVCLEAAPEIIGLIHKTAEAEGLIIGGGYGKLKPTTVRIANFPALERSDIQHLIDVITPAVVR